MRLGLQVLGTTALPDELSAPILLYPPESVAAFGTPAQPAAAAVSKLIDYVSSNGAVCMACMHPLSDAQPPARHGIGSGSQAASRQAARQGLADACRLLPQQPQFSAIIKRHIAAAFTSAESALELQGRFRLARFPDLQASLTAQLSAQLDADQGRLDQGIRDITTTRLARDWWYPAKCEEMCEELDRALCVLLQEELCSSVSALLSCLPAGLELVDPQAFTEARCAKQSLIQQLESAITKIATITT